MLQRACKAWAKTAARWAAVGFVHGMLNTDNLQLDGISIDVASGSFLAEFSPDDDGGSGQGRYSFGRQSRAVEWGLRKLGTALAVGGRVVGQEEAEGIVGKFGAMYRREWLREMRKKLGLRCVEAERGSLHLKGGKERQRGSDSVVADADDVDGGEEEDGEGRKGRGRGREREAGGVERCDAGREGRDGQSTLGPSDRMCGPDVQLISSLLATMMSTMAEFTQTFRCLIPPTPANGHEMLARMEQEMEAGRGNRADCGPKTLSPSDRAAILEQRASRKRPLESVEVLQQLRTAARGELANPHRTPTCIPGSHPPAAREPDADARARRGEDDRSRAVLTLGAGGSRTESTARDDGTDTGTDAGADAEAHRDRQTTAVADAGNRTALRVLQSRVERRLEQHSAADALVAAAKAVRLSSEAELRQRDADAWDAWLAAYAQRCLSQRGGADACMMRAANPRRVPRRSELGAAAREAGEGRFEAAQSLLAETHSS